MKATFLPAVSVRRAKAISFPYELPLSFIFLSRHACRLPYPGEYLEHVELSHGFSPRKNLSACISRASH